MKVRVEKDHYVIDGLKYIRVTRILDVIARPEFYRWYANKGFAFCEGVKKNRAAFGTRVHKEICNYLNGEEVAVDNEEMWVSLFMFRDWALGHHLEMSQSELHVKDDEFMYAGTCDFVGRCLVDGKIRNLLIDWKTSKRISDYHKLQISAYLHAYEEMYDKRLDGAGILLIRDGKTKFKYLSHFECEEEFPFFCAARKLYEWKHGV